MGNGYRLCILGYVNGWIGDRVKAGITSVLEFKFSRVEVCVVVKYGTSEGECKERRKEYWILDRNMDK